MSKPSPVPLPKGFVSIGDICSWEDDRLRAHTFVSVIGIVIDVQDAVQTRGQDWKASVTFYDISTQDDHEASLKLNIFRKQARMPSCNCGDIVLVLDAKVQAFRDASASLVTNFRTCISLFRPGREMQLERMDFKGDAGRLPNNTEVQYVEHFHRAIDRARVPDVESFQERRTVSVSIKDKFRQLKDVTDGTFSNLVVELAKEPYDLGGSLTIWVTDYTENPHFYNSSSRGMVDNQDGDPFGYTDKFYKKPAEVEQGGLSGKYKMQITVWEPHASVIRGCRLKTGDWVELLNVQIKFGNNNANLEGFLREDRANPSKQSVCICDVSGGSNVDTRLKEAVRRKRDVEKSRKKDMNSIQLAEAAGQKRKRALEEIVDPPVANSKARSRNKRSKGRAQKAAQTNGVVSNVENTEVCTLTSMSTLTAAGDTNTQVKCEAKDKPLSRVAELLELPLVKHAVGGKVTEFYLPFKEVSYRVNVRVVDFWPHKLQKFAIPSPAPKAQNVYGMLSDNEESEDSESEQEIVWDDNNAEKWEWRFWLQLEDAAQDETSKKQRVWVIVNHSDAEYLTSINACNLRENSGQLDALREKMSQLWGDLEEQKLKHQPAKRPSGAQGPPDSPNGKVERPGFGAQNLAFHGCVREYGKKVPEDDPVKANAGKGKRFQRVHALFGTKICG